MTTRKKRRYLTAKYIHRQVKLFQLMDKDMEIEPHYFHKKSSLGCKVPGCSICGNPRRTRGEKTLQELKGEGWEYEY